MRNARVSRVRLSPYSMVALVAGASRGCGREVAIGVGDIGATLYVTGRGAPPVDEKLSVCPSVPQCSCQCSCG
jgi:NAD(P)-dependent dehydrogenase (short-subunit alcohol dehydrogenase family)